MGGNAFEMAQRVSAEDYRLILGDIQFHLGRNRFVDLVDFSIPESVREKESHGDIDILVVGPAIEGVKELLTAIYRCDGEIKNPSGYNLLLNCRDSKVQVDLNKVSPFDLDFATGYFSWNDLGNLIGRIAHRQGLKFGHDGLWYVHRRGDHQLGEILLTADFEEAIEYLGFDVAEYRLGFDTFEQMFEWVKSSKYFEPCAYPLEHRNHAARVRDRKRKTYMAFLQWVGFDGEYTVSDKDAWLQEHKVCFPGLAKRIYELDEEFRLSQLYKEKVNGTIVRDLTGLEGKELGELMSVVKRVLPRPTALKYCPATIEAGIMFAFQVYKDEK